MNKKKNQLQILALATGCFACLCYLLMHSGYFHSHPPRASYPAPLVPGPENMAAYEKWEKGRVLFRSSCLSCHNPIQNSLGPVLAGATLRWKNAGPYKGKTGEQWLIAWVRNWKDVVKAGYPYAVNMAASRQAEMNLFNQLTDEQIELILQYADEPEKFQRSFN